MDRFIMTIDPVALLRIERPLPAGGVALAFWERAASDERVGDGFRRTRGDNAVSWGRLTLR